MNEVIGPVSYGGKDAKESFQKPFSEKTGEMLDNEVRKMIMYAPRLAHYTWKANNPFDRAAHKRTKELLTEKKEEVVKVAERLLEKEILTRYVAPSTFSIWVDSHVSGVFSQDMIELLGKRPFEGRSDDMDKYLDKQGEKSAPPPFEQPPQPEPSLASKTVEVR
jgi:AFG3 family protein